MSGVESFAVIDQTVDLLAEKFSAVLVEQSKLHGMNTDSLWKSKQDSDTLTCPARLVDPADVELLFAYDPGPLCSNCLYSHGNKSYHRRIK